MVSGGKNGVGTPLVKALQRGQLLLHALLPNRAVTEVKDHSHGAFDIIELPFRGDHVSIGPVSSDHHDDSMMNSGRSPSSSPELEQTIRRTLRDTQTTLLQDGRPLAGHHDGGIVSRSAPD